MSWKRMIRWLRSYRPTQRMAPPPPPPERIQAAREAALRAQRQLQEARLRVNQVDTHAQTSQKIHTRNNLGPAIIKALHPGA